MDILQHRQLRSYLRICRTSTSSSLPPLLVQAVRKSLEIWSPEIQSDSITPTLYPLLAVILVLTVGTACKEG